MVSRPAVGIVVQTSSDRGILGERVCKHHTRQRLALRARAVLLASQGVADSEIATELGITRPTLLDRRERFAEASVNALIGIRPGRGRKPEISGDRIETIVKATLHTKPQGGCTGIV